MTKYEEKLEKQNEELRERLFVAEKYTDVHKMYLVFYQYGEWEGVQTKALKVSSEPQNIKLFYNIEKAKRFIEIWEEGNDEIILDRKEVLFKLPPEGFINRYPAKCPDVTIDMFCIIIDIGDTLGND